LNRAILDKNEFPILIKEVEFNDVSRDSCSFDESPVAVR
jgi:hypothetical protein